MCWIFNSEPGGQKLGQDKVEKASWTLNRDIWQYEFASVLIHEVVCACTLLKTFQSVDMDRTSRELKCNNLYFFGHATGASVC